MVLDPVLDTVELPLTAVPAGPGPPVAAQIAEQIGAALELAGGGDRDTARSRLITMWQDLGPGGAAALPRALLAHHLAALQDDPDRELWWHQRALQAGQLATDAQLAAWGMPIPARALFPLLHLRLAQCHHRGGDLTSAREHLHQARTWAPALPPDAYGQRVRTGLRHLGERLAPHTPPSGTHRAR